eukprot:scaffold1715_cov93-Cylindrotheca_fusiformis.AAC.1
MNGNRILASKSNDTTQQSDLRSIGNGTSSSTPSGEQSSEDIDRPVYNAPTVAINEEKNIFRAKCLVAFILVLATATVATSAYILVKDQERSNFENQFRAYASEIASVSGQKADQLFDALDSFAVMVGSQAAVENELRNTSWPFYTIPDFSVKGESLANLIGSGVPQMIRLAP